MKKLLIAIIFVFSFQLVGTNLLADQFVYKEVATVGAAETKEKAVQNAIATAICAVNKLGHAFEGGCKMARYDVLRLQFSMELAETKGGFHPKVKVMKKEKDVFGQHKITIKTRVVVWSDEIITARMEEFSGQTGIDFAGMKSDIEQSLGAQNESMSRFLNGSSDFNKALVIIMDAYGLKNEADTLRRRQAFLENGDINSSGFNSAMKEVHVLHNSSIEIMEKKIKSGEKLGASSKKKLESAYPLFYSGIAKTGAAVALGVVSFKSLDSGSGDGLAMLAQMAQLAFIANEVFTSFPKMKKAADLLQKYGEENNLEIPDSAKDTKAHIDSLNFS